jgi:hypothetical protein
MRKERVDPRDIVWEQDEARYRVYFWDRSRMASHEYAISDAGIDEVLAWARGHAQDKGWTYTVYVEVTSPDRPGLVVIEGVAGDPFEPVE